AKPIVDASHGPYGRAMQLWQRLPVPIANWLGPSIRQYLSN
ncbi:peptidoglycan bridge formation protein FemAB, partial [Candidatus Entotheonella serta]